MIFRNQEEADAALQEWQERLSLRDWDLKVRIVRQEKMSSHDVMGNANCVFESKQALIKLVHPLDYPTDTHWEQDHEETLVHELLHIHCWGFSDKDPDSPQGIAEEQMVSTLARALVKYKYEMLEIIKRIELKEAFNIGKDNQEEGSN